MFVLLSHTSVSSSSNITWPQIYVTSKSDYSEAHTCILVIKEKYVFDFDFVLACMDSPIIGRLQPVHNVFHAWIAHIV